VLNHVGRNDLIEGIRQIQVCEVKVNGHVSAIVESMNAPKTLCQMFIEKAKSDENIAMAP
jgi:hypothetical protein